MNVSDLITLLATLSIGLDQPSDSDIPIYLTYLNLAYFELLQGTLVQNPNVPIITETLNCTNGVLAQTQYSIFIIRRIWNPVSNRPLTRTNRDKVEENDPGYIVQGTNPQQWFYDSGQVNIYPIFTGQLGIRYMQTPNALKITNSSNEILIPTIFQQILADGAAYYLFQQETGFKDALKMAESKRRWEEGKIKLFNYLKSLGGQNSYSNFSPV